VGLVISFGVQAHPAATGVGWTELARRVEELGFEALCVPDHPGSTSAPFVALAAAAGATSTLRLGTAVVNAGAWEPVALAAEVATLDVLSGGRAILGVGAGHTPAEWTMVGRTYPPAAERVARMVEVVDATRRLLRGETVTLDGDHVRLDGAALGWPQPPRDAVPLLVGGNGRGVLRYGARVADVVELTGTGRTLADGHSHSVEWTAAAVQERVDLIRSSAPAGRSPRLGALVQRVEVTGDRVGATAAFRAALAEIVPEEGCPTVEDLLSVPFVLIGSEDEIVEHLRALEARWGIERFVVRPDAIEALRAVVERLGRSHL
jgi:probable F420-dependent oxidoreductase